MEREKLNAILAAHKKWLINKSGEKANLCEADLSGAYMRWANLREADMRWANLRGADLREANLREADLRGANLCEADLSGADMRWANLRGADLREADMRWANLRGADLRGADLRGADLRGANLCGADLRGANLCEADLRGANLDFSVWPLWCGSLGVKIDKRIFCQLAYHLCRTVVDDEECRAAQKALYPLANQFHRVEECGELIDKENPEIKS